MTTIRLVDINRLIVNYQSNKWSKRMQRPYCELWLLKGNKCWKNCSLYIMLTATDKKTQNHKKWYYPPSRRLNVSVMLQYQPDRPGSCKSVSDFALNDVLINLIGLYYTVPELWLLVMAALWNRAGHYIFALWFLLSFYPFFPSLLSRRRLDV